MNGKVQTQAVGNPDNVVILGSAALNAHYPDEVRLPGDYDIAGTYDDCLAWIKLVGAEITQLTYPKPNKMVALIDGGATIVEAEIAWGDDQYTTDELIRLVYEDLEGGKRVPNFPGIVPSIDVLYMLKMSHRYLKNSPHFLKTMEDILFLRNKCAKICVKHREFYDARKIETYGYKHPRLNQTKKDFFTDDVPYVYDHDDIHEVMKHRSLPAYKYYQEPDSEVDCSKEMFFNVSEDIRLYGVLEETYVLALERSQIPSGFTEDPRVSFNIALMKVCTSITSGWFRHFAWENYYTIQGLYDDTYVDRFKAALARGEVKRYGE